MARKILSPFAAALVAAAIAAVPVVSSTGGTTALWSVSDTVSANSIPIRIEPSVPEQPSISVPSEKPLCWGPGNGDYGHETTFAMILGPSVHKLNITFKGDHKNDGLSIGAWHKTGSDWDEPVEVSDLGDASPHLVTVHKFTGNTKRNTVIFEVFDILGHQIGGPHSVIIEDGCTSTAVAPALVLGGSALGAVPVGDVSGDIPAYPGASTTIDMVGDELADVDHEVVEGGWPAEPGDVVPEVADSELDSDEGETGITQPTPEAREELEVDSPEDQDPIPVPDESESGDSASDGLEAEGPHAIVPLPQVVETAPAPEPEAVEPESDAGHEECEHLDAEHSADECPGLLPEEEAVKPEPEEGVEPEPAPEPEPEDGVEPEPEPSPDEVL